MSTLFQRLTKVLGWAFILLCSVAAVAQLHKNSISSGTDPYGIYWCGGGRTDGDYRDKPNPVYEVGKTLGNVNGIVVLDCHRYDGGGGARIVSCPAGSPFSYCVENTNDGAGNHIEIGVLEFNTTTDPNAQYGGCASGSGYRTKSSVILEARDTLRDVSGIVVTKCTKADGPPGPKKVPCSKKNAFYAACYMNSDDGVGNHVELGLMKVHGLPDVTGQYGGVVPGTGYRSKSVLVTEVGKKLDQVLSIVPWYGGWNWGGNDGSHIVGCPPEPYTYCIANTNDPAGNMVHVGVIERP
jgi:hypothetical protein